MSASTPSTAPEPVVHVAVAAIVDDSSRVLVSLRPAGVHQGGLWEFPGGKLEAGEQVVEALHREIREELGIRISACRPLIRVPWRYADRSVLLDVWKVTAWEGEAVGREGQSIEWRVIDTLVDADFPAADRPVIRALQLPDHYLITPHPGNDLPAFLGQLEQRLRDGIRLVQLRAKDLGDADYQALAEPVVELCHRHGARVLLNADPALAASSGADGVHLDSRRLRQLSQRPLAGSFRVAASCHTREDLEQAAAIGADFALLSPVCRTATHPGAEPLGWDRFADLVRDCRMPVFALGGMTPAHIDQAVASGGQGIAAIRALWEPAG